MVHVSAGGFGRWPEKEVPRPKSPLGRGAFLSADRPRRTKVENRKSRGGYRCRIKDHAHAIETWFKANARDLPWRANRTPWRAFVSEVMLQQTQAARVAERFDAVMDEFPTPAAMASAPLDALLMHWQGLGYYRRARNLHAAAGRIVEDFDGATPCDAESLRILPGIGRYTAGSIASIAGGQREAIVDGNVRRVLCRLHGDDAPVGDGDLEKRTWARAKSLVDACNDPSLCNEGLMELGALICTPRRPNCQACPLAKRCEARRSGDPTRFPAARATSPKPVEHVHALVIRRRGRVLLERRSDGGRWAGTWQPPMIIATREMGPTAVAQHLDLTGELGKPVAGKSFEHVLTHRRLLVQVMIAEAVTGARLAGRDRRWLDPKTPGVPLSSMVMRVMRSVADAQATPCVAAGSASVSG